MTITPKQHIWRTVLDAPRIVIQRIYEISQRHKANEHLHAYYAIPVFLGFVITYALIQIFLRFFPDFAFHANGYHIHHYTYGIVLLLVFGYISLWTQSPRVKHLCALAYGVSAAFIIDEAWMWFTLNGGPGYQDFDLAFFAGALFLGIFLTPLFFNEKRQPSTAMKISFVIPAYNEEAYLDRTLNAVLTQTYPDTEIIVVNNNSTDSTAAVAQKYPGVRLIDEPRQGILFARECGRRAATGDIIASIDADCNPHPAWAQTAVRYFSDPNVVAVSGPYDLYDAPPFFQWTHLQSQKLIFPLLTRALYALFGRGVIAMGGNTFARASALAAINGYNTDIKFYAEDMDTANRLAQVGRVAYHNDISIRTSARRYLKHGIMKIQGKYLLNYIWVILFRRPFRNEFGE